MDSTKNIDDGGPAFPCVTGTDVTNDGLIQVQFQNGDVQWVRHAPGMSLRDYFEAKAMAGILAMPWHPEMGCDWRKKTEDVIAWAREIADAMILARQPQ